MQHMKKKNHWRWKKMKWNEIISKELKRKKNIKSHASNANNKKKAKNNLKKNLKFYKLKDKTRKITKKKE